MTFGEIFLQAITPFFILFLTILFTYFAFKLGSPPKNFVSWEEYREYTHTENKKNKVRKKKTVKNHYTEKPKQKRRGKPRKNEKYYLQ